jgi:hypothetical protein
MHVDTSIQRALKPEIGQDAAMDACIRAGIGDILKAPIPPGSPTDWRGTAEAGPIAYYYLLNKPE